MKTNQRRVLSKKKKKLLQEGPIHQNVVDDYVEDGIGEPDPNRIHSKRKLLQPKEEKVR